MKNINIPHQDRRSDRFKVGAESGEKYHQSQYNRATPEKGNTMPEKKIMVNYEEDTLQANFHVNLRLITAEI